MDTRECTQTRCGYYQNGGCKSCESCKAKSLLINTSCGRCLRCECVPNELRWSEDKPIEIKEQNNPEKEIVLEVT